MAFYLDKYTFIAIWEVKYWFIFLSSLEILCQNLAGGYNGTYSCLHSPVAFNFSLPSTSLPTEKRPCIHGMNTLAWLCSKNPMVSCPSGLRVDTWANTAALRMEHREQPKRSLEPGGGLLERKFSDPSYRLEVREGVPTWPQSWPQGIHTYLLRRGWQKGTLKSNLKLSFAWSYGWFCLQV